MPRYVVHGFVDKIEPSWLEVEPGESENGGDSTGDTLSF